MNEATTPSERLYVHCGKCVDNDNPHHIEAVVFDDLLFLVCHKHSKSPLLSVAKKHCIVWLDDKPVGRF